MINKFMLKAMFGLALAVTYGICGIAMQYEEYLARIAG
jgi:hypothetical protein